MLEILIVLTNWRPELPLKRCERKGCRSRNTRGVWLIDGHVYCCSCYERWQETHFFDEHRVVRVSNRESDFSENVHFGTSRPIRV